jgi:rhodanese-related sulfurtransferase
MSRLTAVLLALCLFMGLTSVAGAAGWTEISAQDLKAKMDAKEITLIYPLSRIEYRNLHIVGDVNIPMSKLADNLPADKNQPLAFYCLGRK